MLALALLGATSVMAQSKTGTTVGQFLLIEPSARVAAMGNAGVTTFGEVTSAFYNPGSLGHLDGSDAQFTHSSWLAGITYNYAAVALRVGAVNTLLLTVTALNSGEIDVRTVEQPLGTGERYEVTNLALGLGMARRITDRFSAGLQVQYIQETIWHSRMNALALDLGVLYELPFRAYLGASVSNFGTRGRFDGRDLRIRYDQDPDRFGDNSSLPAALYTEDFPLPILFRVGVGLPIALNPANEVHLVVNAYQPSDNTNSVSFGGEWTFMDVFSARAGYQHLFQEDAETGLTLGAGLQYALGRYGLRFDFAWNEYGRIGNVQRFTVGFGF
ncbi:MAG: hypothetical protein D6685_00225 [Bacteroidetes bacterium]|nr:hypothetical protein AWN76_006435 [Rhodothermaceae bacterium RA]RMH70299.1 MAG: hypothetical protein D6685_00225 [Bacteroidota bacterium]